MCFNVLGFVGVLMFILRLIEWDCYNRFLGGGFDFGLVCGVEFVVWWFG